MGHTFGSPRIGFESGKEDHNTKIECGLRSRRAGLSISDTFGGTESFKTSRNMYCASSIHLPRGTKVGAVHSTLDRKAPFPCEGRLMKSSTRRDEITLHEEVGAAPSEVCGDNH